MTGQVVPHLTVTRSDVPPRWLSRSTLARRLPSDGSHKVRTCFAAVTLAFESAIAIAMPLMVVSQSVVVAAVPLLMTI